MRIVRLERELLDEQTRHGDAVFGGRFHLVDFGADHHARQRRRRFLPRIAGRDLLAETQDRRRIAEPLHLFELMADVEDGAAFALEPLEHDEELICLLRRQHRGRLVENEQLRILHQRAHDFDALALADRQPPHLALGIERQAVDPRGFRKPRRDGGKRLGRRQAERHVLGDRQVLEQREMLEHHADAEPARLGRAGQHDFFAHPAQFAAARLDQAVHHLHEGRFARPILAEQRVDFGRKQIEVDAVIGEKIAIALAYGNGTEQRR